MPDWALISKTVQDFYDAHGWWASYEEILAMQAQQPAPPPTAAETTVGNGSDTLVLKVSQDHFRGDAQYKVFVDGWQWGGPYAAKAAHGSGASDTLTIRGEWGPGQHWVNVQFLNDDWGGPGGGDRNLYVDGATFNGRALTGGSLSLPGNATEGLGFTEVATPPPPPPPSATTTVGNGADALVLKVSQDAYLGDAQFTVKVDGWQWGGSYTAKALHGAGASDTVTVRGDWGTGKHWVEVTFLNDAWSGGSGGDRNLYVDGAAFNGSALGGTSLALTGSGTKGFGFTEWTDAASAPSDFTASPVWADDFDGSSVDRAKWPIEYGGGTPYDNGAFRWVNGKTTVSGGSLHIAMDKQPNGVWDVGGMGSTPNQWNPGIDMQYGKVEIRAKVSQEVWGSGPVFLLWPSAPGVWPPEVDILETPRGNGMFTNHWIGPDGGDAYQPTLFDVALDQWHTYGLEWTPNRMTMTLDGRAIQTLTENIPHIEMAIGLQGHIGAAHEGWYGGSPNGVGIDHLEIAVDYVRVYDYIG